jgi:cAMP-dependent protein kinase regulator
LFIVFNGTLECTKVFEGNSEPKFLKNYVSGDVFGELALMYNAPRAATIVAVEESTCFCLDRDTFNAIVK